MQFKLQPKLNIFMCQYLLILPSLAPVSYRDVKTHGGPFFPSLNYDHRIPHVKQKAHLKFTRKIFLSFNCSRTPR